MRLHAAAPALRHPGAIAQQSFQVQAIVRFYAHAGITENPLRDPSCDRPGVLALEYAADQAGTGLRSQGALWRLGEDDPGRANSTAMFLVSAARLALFSGEELMKELNGNGAFTDR
jgi:hypothetical protein